MICRRERRRESGSPYGSGSDVERAAAAQAVRQGAWKSREAGEHRPGGSHSKS